MSQSLSGEVRWNLFARELEDILAARGLRLGQLDDRRDEMGSPLLHREKVRRLKRSLRVPSFTVLNPEDLERVIHAFDMSPKEQNRLYAALLGTSIEDLLMDRIDPLSALHAAEQLLPLLRQALEQQNAQGEPARIRGGAGAIRDFSGETSDLDERFEKALRMLDRATLNLHLCQSSDVFLEKIARAQQARDGFQTALRLLEKGDDTIRSDGAWQVWHAEAERGGAAATDLLAQFGIGSSPPD
jgi:hypothetical protein